MAGHGDTAALEAERQVVEAAERYREVTASMEAGGRPETGQRAAVKAVGRALQLVAFVLQRAAAAGVTVDRLVELTGWEPELIRQVLERAPEPALVARVAPAAADLDDLSERLPPDELEAEIAAERRPRTEPLPRAKIRPRKPSRRAQRARLDHPAARTPPVPIRARGRDEVVDLLEQDGVMCLEDPAAAATAARRPWTRGLRGSAARAGRSLR